MCCVKKGTHIENVGAFMIKNKQYATGAYYL